MELLEEMVIGKARVIRAFERSREDFSLTKTRNLLGVHVERVKELIAEGKIRTRVEGSAPSSPIYCNAVDVLRLIAEDGAKRRNLM